jgi:hypothetical protein
VNSELQLGDQGHDGLGATMTALDMTKRDGSAKRPTIYLLSSGADPATDISDLAHRERIEFHLFAMGQGQESKAMRKLTKCAYEGTWLMLQNCHLNCDFMGDLDRLFQAGKYASKVGEVPNAARDGEKSAGGNGNGGGGGKGRGGGGKNVKESRVLTKRGGGSRTGASASSSSSTLSSTGSNNKSNGMGGSIGNSNGSAEFIIQSSFRLWLTILPTDRFPESLLQMSVVVSSEPPNGLRAGLLGCYAKDGPATEFFHDVGHEQWPKFLFAICFLHISVCQRRAYGQFGWSFPYAFGKADLSASLMYSRTLFDSSDSGRGVDWISVRFVVCEILYGGLITADSDRDVVSALGRSLLDGRIYTNGYNIAPGLSMPGGNALRGGGRQGGGVAGDKRSSTKRSSNAAAAAAAAAVTSMASSATAADALAAEGGGTNITTFVDYAEALPSNDHPAWYGLHENAAFSSMNQSGVDLLRNIWKCLGVSEKATSSTPSSSSSSSRRHRTVSHENRISALEKDGAHSQYHRTITTICDKIAYMHSAFAMLEAVPAMRRPDLLPFNFVLRQEYAALKRVYRILGEDVEVILHSLSDPSTASAKAIELQANLMSNGLPAQWCDLLPSCGAFPGLSIAPWFARLQAVHEQIEAWVVAEIKICRLHQNTRDSGSGSGTAGSNDESSGNAPDSAGSQKKRSTRGIADAVTLTHRLDVYEMGLLFNPRGFLVALRQEVVRLKRRSMAGTAKSAWSIEDTRLRTSVLRPKDYQDSGLQDNVPDLGTNLRGMSLEGAAWSAGTLIEQAPLEDIVGMPVIQLSVVHARSASFSGRAFTCPVYRYSGSRDPDSRVFEVLLPSDVPADHWILRGVAMSLARRLGEH